MFGKIIPLWILFVMTASAADECGVCMSNYVLCVNNTSYNLCTDETETAVTTLSPIDDEIYNCNSGEYCTNSLKVCETDPDGINVIAICDQASSGSCSTCTGKSNGDLICLSATQFAICNGDTSNPLACPTDQFCSEDLLTVGLKKVCAPQSVLDYMEVKQTCNIEGTVTPPTTTISPASSTTPLSDSALQTACSDAGQTAAYFQIPHPTAGECRKYVYCERQSSGYLALEMKCKSGQFYSTSEKKCIQATQCPN